MDKSSFKFPDITEKMNDIDVNTLYILSKSDQIHSFFNFRTNNLRSNITVSSKELAKSKKINNLYGWRMVTKLQNMEKLLLCYLNVKTML